MSRKVSWPGTPLDRTSRPASWNLPTKDAAARPAFPAAAAQEVPPADPVAVPRPPDRKDEPPIVASPPAPKTPAPATPNPMELELQRRAQMFATAFEEIAQAFDRQSQNMAQEVLDLGLAVAEELAGGAISIAPTRVLTIIDEALDLLAEEREIKIRLHPALLEELDRTGALERIKENPRFKVRSDPTVGETGCVVESKSGKVDARLRARLSKLRYLLSQGEGYEEGEP